MKQVLIITYYWPPAGGAGVQRWLKFTKYLRQFGWEPIIYTPENSEIPEIDNSLLKDIPENITVLKRPIREPYKLYKLFTLRKGQRINVGFLSETEKPKLTEKISVWIRSNLFIPDARCFWINPSVKYLTKYISEHNIDTIITTGPPHSLHIIGLRLKLKCEKLKLKLRWIADFRDPWTNIDFYKDLLLTKRADRKHHRLEKDVLKNADAVITIGATLADEFNAIYNRDYHVITNGFDYDDVHSTGNLQMDTKFSIAHIGTMPRSRNPHTLWKVLKQLTETDKEFSEDLEIKLVGKLDISIKEDITNYGLDKYVQRQDYLPHDQVVKVQKQSQLLLLVVNQTENAKGILTGKFFEYLASMRPILCIGPANGDVAKIINETKSGKVIDFEDENTLQEIILIYYYLFKRVSLKTQAENIEKYSRKALTGKLAEVLDKLK